MIQQDIIYSETRGTWNLFVDNEWYYEGDYETCCDMMMRNADEQFEQFYDDYDEYLWEMDNDYDFE